jgi:hypothetical protein
MAAAPSGPCIRSLYIGVGYECMALAHSCHPRLLQGIEVCLISPGAVRTPIWSKSGADAAALLAAAPAEADTLYGPLIRQVCELSQQKLRSAHRPKDLGAERLKRSCCLQRLQSLRKCASASRAQCRRQASAGVHVISCALSRVPVAASHTDCHISPAIGCRRSLQLSCTLLAIVHPTTPQVQAGAAHAESRGVSAGDVAAVVCRTLEADRPRTRQVVGTAAVMQMAVRR